MTKSIVDLRGQKFDLLAPVAIAGFNKYRNALWLCQCDCGKTKIVASNYLRRKDRYKSCGCEGKNKSDRIIDQRFGFWTVKEKVKKTGSKALFICECDCGTIAKQSAFDLINQKTKSCGCFSHRTKKGQKLEGYAPRSTIKRDHPLYSTWLSMKERCENASHKKWHRYGGRGIKVCERWQNFAFFVKDMHPKPDGTSLDRINNNGDYEPSNCRWATPVVQAQNTRRNVLIERDGVTLCISEWARRLGVSHATIKAWTKKGWGAFVDNPSD